MSNDDWYRRAGWTAHDREEFYARLRRTRSAASKAQYMRMQAIHLAGVGLHTAALGLLEDLLAEVPERLELASAHLQRAQSLAQLGRAAEAVEAYRAALQAERDFPNVCANAWLDFGYFVIESGLSGLYDEVLAVLEEFGNGAGLRFPKAAYQQFAVRAMIADARGDHDAAKDYAERCLVAAGQNQSGLRYHPTVGLVGAQPQWLEKRLQELARR